MFGWRVVSTWMRGRVGGDLLEPNCRDFVLWRAHYIVTVSACEEVDEELLRLKRREQLAPADGRSDPDRKYDRAVGAHHADTVAIAQADGNRIVRGNVEHVGRAKLVVVGPAGHRASVELIERAAGDEQEGEVRHRSF